MSLFLVEKKIQADMVVLCVKAITVANPFPLKLPQAHIFAILFRVFGWKWIGQHLNTNPASTVHEDHARDYV